MHKIFEFFYLTISYIKFYIYEISRFLFVKTISSVKFNKYFVNWQLGHPIDQNFICNIRYGDLIKDSGDILLCPVSENFKPSNPFLRKVVEIEGKKLKRKLDLIKNDDTHIGSEHVVFLPCLKLKYRGILFVEVDFYSDDREEINARRIAEAFSVAQKYSCKKLSCPRNFLYSPARFERRYEYLHFELAEVADCLPEKVKIDFVVEYVIQKNWTAYYPEFFNFWRYYDYSNALVEFLPACAQILPWYRKKMKSINTVYTFSARTSKLIRKILTSESLTKKQMFKAFKKLRGIIGDYYETGVNRGNQGYEDYILELCKEMPWNFKILKETMEDFYNSIDREKEQGIAIQAQTGIFT